MSTSVLPKHMALQRHIAANSSTSSSASTSPVDTPRQSPSTTSLSSLASEEQFGPGKLLDTYGHEFEIPDFTIKQIRDAIPAHCFKRSGLRGLSYVFRDVALLAGTFCLFHIYLTPETVPYMPARAVLWGLYTFIQGLFGTGLWVMAHECGHQSFSTSKVFNDTVGWICHSALLVPYFSWKISHGKHHKATGNVQRDMVFVPKSREVYASRVGRLVHDLTELTEETPIQTAIHLILQQLFGWPTYLISNVTGHNNHDRQLEGRGKGKKNGMFNGVNHFNPSSPLYEAKDAKLVALSDLGLLIAGSVLFYIGNRFGWINLLVWYILPYFWVNHWLGMCQISLYLRYFEVVGQLIRPLQSRLPISNTPIPVSPITNQRLGTSRGAQQPPSIVNLASLVVISSMVSLRLMFFITMSAPFHFTMRMKRPRRSRL